MKPRFKSTIYISVAIFAMFSVGILSFQGITNVQASESAQSVPVYGQGTEATQQDCYDLGGSLEFNYETRTYECMLE